MTTAGNESTGSGNGVKLLLAWLFVGIPLLYGIVMTAIKAAALFTG